MLETRKPESEWYCSNQEANKPQQGTDRAKKAPKVDK